ncbi:TPA: 3-deoxy-manno-octulosonate cytidylyltransferase [Enterobacter hormaechei subsp. xiangfangensis]
MINHPNSAFTVVIPVRMDSTRLPGKAMQDINGKPMIAHTIDRAKESGAQQIIVATDHPAIFDEAIKAGVNAVMTPETCASGTDRIALALASQQVPSETIIVNLQGDEPMFSGHWIAQLAERLVMSGSDMATVAVSDLDAKQLADPNVVKVVADSANNALYFSRAGVPFSRDGQLVEEITMRKYFMRHVGVYAYRAGFLRTFVNWGVAPLEYTEKLEQLRVLWNGGRIHLLRFHRMTAKSVDTPEDLMMVRQLMQQSV